MNPFAGQAGPGCAQPLRIGAAKKQGRPRNRGGDIPVADCPTRMSGPLRYDMNRTGDTYQQQERGFQVADIGCTLRYSPSDTRLRAAVML